MRLFIVKYLLMILALFVGEYSLGRAGGTDETHGGDTLVLDFMNLLGEMSHALAQVPSAQLPDIEFAERFHSAMNQVRVRSEAQVFLDGHPVAAINYPKRSPPEIVLSQAMWPDVFVGVPRYEQLALHEMLFVMGYDDSEFRISQKLGPVLSLYREISLANILSRYLAKPGHPLRDLAINRLESRTGFTHDRTIPVLYNLGLLASQELDPHISQLYSLLALQSIQLARREVFYSPMAGCSLPFFEALSWSEAIEVTESLKNRLFDSAYPKQCDTLRY